MAFLFNVASGRDLYEGDQVRVLRTGKTGTVVGFDLFGERPILVQYSGNKGLVQEATTANAVEVTSDKAPTLLEPLPEIRRILKDSTDVITCGKLTFLKLTKGGSISLIPKRNWNLRALCESRRHQSIEARVKELLKYSYVTRLPHLVRTT